MLQNWYNIGAASVTNGQTTVTGHNTLWKTGLGAQPIYPGDKFGTHVEGGGVRIVDVVDDTTIILARPWWGPTQEDDPYEIEIVPDRSRVQETTRRLLELLASRGFFRYDQAGLTAELSDYDNRARGFAFLATDVNPMQLYVKQSDANGDWGGPVAYATGPTGPAPNLAVGSTTTGAPGSSANVGISGVNPNYSLAFTIPGGATLDIGDVSTVNYSEPASAQNVGTIHEAIFDLALPRGARGWAFEPAVEADGPNRDVIRVADFIGGEGSKPAGVGQYLGTGGLVATPAEAKNIRGGIGPQGPRGVKWQGDWDDQTEYVIGDLVVDEDGNDDPAIFIALTTNTDSKPRDNATDWAFFPGTFALPVDYGLITEVASEARDYGTIA